jgi:putative DNA primase/helicase
MNHTLIATTSPGSLEWSEEFTQILKDADVVILYDYDNTGIRRRDLLCAALHGKVKRLRVVDLPGLEYREKHGQDITDWLAMEGNTIEQFKTIVAQTADYTPPVAKMPIEGGLNVVSLEDLLALNLPERKMLLDPFLTEQGLIMLYAKRGVGKTHIALGIAHAVASGGTFLKWSAPQARKVLYIDGEMPAVSMQERLRKISSSASHKPPAGYLAIINQDLQTNSLPDLASKLGRDAIEPYVQDASLIVVDNISSLFRSGAENEAESWQPVQDWALDLRRRGKSILFVHHAGKSGQQRGTSKKEDTLDVVISLRQPDEYRAEEGASFELHFEKTRNFAGDHALPFHAQLIEEADGNIRWQIAPIDHDPMVIEIATLKEEGKTIAEIMIKTQLSKSQVETKIKKAKKTGLLS